MARHNDMNKGHLPAGWKARRDAVRSVGRLSFTTVYLHEGEGLAVKRAGRRGWMLIHYYHDTGHRFKTARAAIEHAEDARIHGH